MLVVYVADVLFLFSLVGMLSDAVCMLMIFCLCVLVGNRITIAGFPL